MMFDPGFGHFFVEVSTATTNGPKASEAPRLPRKSSCVRNLTSKFTNDLRNHLSRKYHACHTDEKVSDVLHLSCKMTFQTPKCRESPMHEKWK